MRGSLLRVAPAQLTRTEADRHPVNGKQRRALLLSHGLPAPVCTRHPRWDETGHVSADDIERVAKPGLAPVDWTIFQPVPACSRRSVEAGRVNRNITSSNDGTTAQLAACGRTRRPRPSGGRPTPRRHGSPRIRDQVRTPPCRDQPAATKCHPSHSRSPSRRYATSGPSFAAEQSTHSTLGDCKFGFSVIQSWPMKTGDPSTGAPALSFGKGQSGTRCRCLSPTIATSG